MFFFRNHYLPTILSQSTAISNHKLHFHCNSAYCYTYSSCHTSNVNPHNSLSYSGILIRSRHIQLFVVHQIQSNYYQQLFYYSNIPSSQIWWSTDLGNMPMAMYYNPSYYNKHSFSNNSNFSIPLLLPGTNLNSASDYTRYPETIRRSLGTECFGNISSIHTTLIDIAWKTIKLQEMESVV